MSKEKHINIRLKFEGMKIVDQDVNSFDEADNLFRDMKRKFKGGK